MTASATVLGLSLLLKDLASTASGEGEGNYKSCRHLYYQTRNSEDFGDKTKISWCRAIWNKRLLYYETQYCCEHLREKARFVGLERDYAIWKKRLSKVSGDREIGQTIRKMDKILRNESDEDESGLRLRNGEMYLRGGQECEFLKKKIKY